MNGISLIITTYNWKEALELVLKSVLVQKTLPNEVIVADDGSRNDTREMIEKFQQNFPVPLIHSWQEDVGFRAAMSRNKAIAKAKYDYIVIIDGDILLHPHFIENHKQKARKNCFTVGSRVILGPKISQTLLSEQRTKVTFFTPNIKNRKNAINCNLLSQIFAKPNNSMKRAISCNMSFWKTDIVQINGFNEDFVGWGREDSELVARFINSGFQRINLKFCANGFHIYHKENDRKNLSQNDELLANTINNKVKRAQNGLDKYLEV